MASKQYKILMLQKDRTQKNESCIFLRSIFLPIHVVSFRQWWRGSQELRYKKRGDRFRSPLYVL